MLDTQSLSHKRVRTCNVLRSVVGNDAAVHESFCRDHAGNTSARKDHKQHRESCHSKRCSALPTRLIEIERVATHEPEVHEVRGQKSDRKKCQNFECGPRYIEHVEHHKVEGA